MEQSSLHVKVIQKYVCSIIGRLSKIDLSQTFKFLPTLSAKALKQNGINSSTSSCSLSFIFVAIKQRNSVNSIRPVPSSSKVSIMSWSSSWVGFSPRAFMTLPNSRNSQIAFTYLIYTSQVVWGPEYAKVAILAYSPYYFLKNLPIRLIFPLPSTS